MFMVNVHELLICCSSCRPPLALLHAQGSIRGVSHNFAHTELTPKLPCCTLTQLLHITVTSATRVNVNSRTL